MFIDEIENLNKADLALRKDTQMWAQRMVDISKSKQIDQENSFISVESRRKRNPSNRHHSQPVDITSQCETPSLNNSALQTVTNDPSIYDKSQNLSHIMNAWTSSN
jgi:hypothetical protein